MDPIASISGLASGIQWRDMVDQIISVESRPISLLQQRIAAIETRSNAWVSFRSRLDALDSSASTLSSGSPFRSFAPRVSGFASIQPFSAAASTDAREGTYGVTVHELASREKVGSAGFASSSEALGLDGEFLVNGVQVELAATDTLADVADRVNTVGSRAGVQASLVRTSAGGQRLVLTASESGAAGLDLVDGGTGVLRSLGFLDGTVSPKHGTSDGAMSDTFAGSTSSLGTLLGLSTPPTGTVTVGGESVALDLSTMTLEDVAQAIGQAAADAGKAFTAQVVSATADDGSTAWRLDIGGTTDFADAGGILEALGVVEAGRAAEAQSLTSGTAFEDAATGLAATGTTALSDLRIGGAGAGVGAGDTLTVRGTRGDGTSFETTYTVGAADTLDDLSAFLTSGADDFGSGRTASVSVSDTGALVVTDDTAGGSRLSLEIVSNNEGGGTLDFGEITVTTEGRSREITSGRDALVEVDGTFLSSASNQAVDLVPGLTLTLTEATGEAVELTVDRDTESAVSAVTGFVDAYNEIQSWISTQFSGAGASDGVSAPPLSGDSTLRGIRNTLRDVMISQLTAGVTDGARRMAEVGIEIDRYGAFQLDTATLTAALESDPEGVERLFSTFGGTDDAALEFVSSSEETEEGLYAVDITTPASTAAVTGSGFGGGMGVYQDDGVADTLVVRDLDTGSEYRVALNDGDDVGTVVAALNDAFGSATTRRLEASDVLYSDAGGTAAGSSTALADLHDAGGTNMGVAAGDVLTFSGTNRNGSAILLDMEITDPSTQTVQDLLTGVETALGGGVDVRLDGGRLVVEESSTGLSLASLTVSSDNAGGGTFSLGTVDAVEAGRGPVAITASDDGGELRIAHDVYGSAQGFEISVEAGGTDGSASLGLSAGTHTGVDVVGTIGGYAATGSGRLLSGLEGTPTEGLMLTYSGVDTGTIGTTTFSRGIASRMERALSPLLGTGPGSIDGLNEGLAQQSESLDDRIDELNDRLERRREQLVRQFTAMEEALARAQSQGDWLTAQLTRLDNARRD